MWHKPCRTFHPWCPCIKTRCLSHRDRQTCASESTGLKSTEIVRQHQAIHTLSNLCSTINFVGVAKQFQHDVWSADWPNSIFKSIPIHIKTLVIHFTPFKNLLKSFVSKCNALNHRLPHTEQLYYRRAFYWPSGVKHHIQFRTNQVYGIGIGTRHKFL